MGSDTVRQMRVHSEKTDIQCSELLSLYCTSIYGEEEFLVII